MFHYIPFIYFPCWYQICGISHAKIFVANFWKSQISFEMDHGENPIVRNGSWRKSRKCLTQFLDMDIIFHPFAMDFPHVKKMDQPWFLINASSSLQWRLMLDEAYLSTVRHRSGRQQLLRRNVKRLRRWIAIPMRSLLGIWYIYIYVCMYIYICIYIYICCILVIHQSEVRSTWAGSPSHIYPSRPKTSRQFVHRPSRYVWSHRWGNLRRGQNLQ